MQNTYISIFAHLMELAITVFFCNNVFTAKHKKIHIAITGLIFFGVEFLLFQTLHSTAINITINIIIVFLFSLICYNCKPLGALFASLFLSATLTASEFFIMVIEASAFQGNINTFTSNNLVYFISVSLSRLVFFLIAKAAIYAGLYLSEKNSSGFPVFLLLYPLVSIIILYSFWIISDKYELSRNISIAISLASFAIILAIFFIYVFYGKTSKKLEELYNEKIEADRILTDKTYYTILDKQNEVLKQITHDEKNHLTAIKVLANNEEVDKYINSIYEEISDYSMFGNTRNKYLDLLLNKYKSVCNEKSIDFSYTVITANLSFMNPPDIITLISNILDNSVEAASDSENKIIDLTIKHTNGFDVLSCSNSCDKKPTFKNNQLFTSKNNKIFHGYGIKNIKSIVDKYNGEFDWSYNETEKTFIINIAF